MLTERCISVIRAVVAYYVLNRHQIQRLCFPFDKSGRVARRRVLNLVDGGFISRHSLFVLNQAPCPVYYPSRRGCEFLAAHFDDERYLTANTLCPQPHFLYHWLAINDTRMTLEAALARQAELSMPVWVNEHEVVNKAESTPEKRFRLFQLIHEQPRLVCAPDAGFLLARGDNKKCLFLEQDRDTTSAQQIAASKTKGYAAMQASNLHLRIFPDALPAFLVLMVAPSRQRRDSLRRAIRGKPGADRWRFVSANEMTEEAALSSPVYYRCEDDEPTTLVKGGGRD